MILLTRTRKPGPLALTRDFGFHVLIRRSALFSRLLRQTGVNWTFPNPDPLGILYLEFHNSYRFYMYIIQPHVVEHLLSDKRNDFFCIFDLLSHVGTHAIL